MEHLRVISIQDVAGTSLLFLANNFREAELLVCGLKLLLERETCRLGVRGGLPGSAFGGRHLEGAMSPAAARGFRDVAPLANGRRRDSSNRSVSGQVSSDGMGDESVHDVHSLADPIDKIPPGRSSWGNVPGRDYMRGQAATVTPTGGGNGYNEHGVPHYVHGQQVVRDIARSVRLPLPLPLCRVLLLDSTSPVIKKWEQDRGDRHFDKSYWAFPPSTPRELERHPSEHQLIASGSMCGASRTVTFDRPRYGSVVRLSETHAVDADDSKKLVFTVEERNPRRGFSVKVRIILVTHKETACDASVVAEVRPVGKDMSNQAAVHKAFLLVLDEIKLRYGPDGSGLLAGFLKVVDNMAEGKTNANPSGVPKPFHRTGPGGGPSLDEKKVDSGSSRQELSSSATKSRLVSFEDMLKTGRQSPENKNDRPSTPSILYNAPEADPSKQRAPRPSSDSELPNERLPAFTDQKERLIEVKPLPKIRLSLMPSPREEDEDDLSSSSPVPSKPIKKKKKKKPTTTATSGSSFRSPKSSSARSTPLTGKRSGRYSN